MNKADLVNAVAAKTGATKKSVSDVLDAVLDAVMASLKKGDNVTLTGFGTFRSVHQAASEKRNPKTNQPVNVPAKNVPRFRAGKQFREMVA
ncbi:HU family DNA-binding protein [Candidatus Dojkabacteria bacterium]|uniref:HU family DNA-binding protein n=1 Tax=Candidatus Dojkabacteria bacterium TaxID=2099670 RepID=A0A955KZZ0_9BACT|nr:HU family DNA-binding protein [Candidatus Dojkabacteria bacterium]